MKRNVVAFFSGLLFAVGLLISGMTQPEKVVGFLDFGGAWDPSLALVMVGGIGVLMVAQVIAPRVRRPLFAPRFPVLLRNEIDGRMVAGAAVFGVGWGLSGLCPGPAIVSAGGGTMAALVFVPAMLGGMALVRLLVPRSAARPEETWALSQPSR